MSKQLRLFLGLLIWVAAFSSLTLVEVRGDQDHPNPQEEQGLHSSDPLTDPQDCQAVIRDLNPAPPDPNLGTSLDQTFAQAYEAAVSGAFSEAIVLYEKAGDLGTCECDRHHAQAGSMAAQAALDLSRQDRISDRPTQFFWIQLQDLTKGNECVKVR